MALEVSAEFSLVGLVVVTSFVVNMAMASGVIKARKKYVDIWRLLPKLCMHWRVKTRRQSCSTVFRGHQNFLEIVPFFLALLMIGGLQHPRSATAGGVFFLVARFIYSRDYSTGDPKKRMPGAIMGYTGIIVLAGCCISFAVQQLLY